MSELIQEPMYRCTVCDVRFDTMEFPPMCPQGCRRPIEDPDRLGGFSTVTPLQPHPERVARERAERAAKDKAEAKVAAEKAKAKAEAEAKAKTPSKQDSAPKRQQAPTPDREEQY